MKLDKNCVYDLSELTSEEYRSVYEWLLKNDEGWGYVSFEHWKNNNKGYNLMYQKDCWSMQEVKPTTNAKELFYTLENIQVDCSELSEDQIKKMADVFEKAGYKYFVGNKNRALHTDSTYLFLMLEEDKEIVVDISDKDKTTITYEKFMELFAEPEVNKNHLFKDLTLTPVSLDNIHIYGEYNSITEGSDENASFLVKKLLNNHHYDNTNGSIYKFCNDQKLNSWEFDIIKRVVRCRKKGQFKEDLQKTKDLIDLYLKEFTDEK